MVALILSTDITILVWPPISNILAFIGVTHSWLLA